MGFAIRMRGGPLDGQRFVVETEIVVGRDKDCHVVVPDRRLSRRHARFFIQDGALHVEDLGSSLGTYVNGARADRGRLGEGAVVRLAQIDVVVEAGERDRTGPLVKKLVEPTRLEEVRAEDFFTELGLGEGAEALDVVRQRARQFAVLHEVGRVLREEALPEHLLRRVLDLALKVIPADHGFAALVDGDRVTLSVARRTRATQGEFPREGVSRTVLEHVLRAKNAVLSIDRATDARLEDSPSLMIGETRSLIAAPMISGDRMIGVLQLDCHRLGALLSESDLDLLTLVASTIGPAIENSALVRALESSLAELKDAQARLVHSEQLAAIGRFATGIAHEVKNHLSPFMLADVIAQKYPSDREAREAAELMREAQQHILDLVNEIRAFTRGGPEVEDLSPHDVAELVESVLRFARCDAKARRTSIELDAGARPLADLDPRSFRQVILNLIRNAVDALPERGGKIRVRVREQGGRAIVEVLDNGHGIPEEIRARIFEPFFSTKGEAGLGLGLDISRRIIERHKGELRFETELGRGTKFIIAIPARAGGETTYDLPRRT